MNRLFCIYDRIGEVALAFDSQAGVDGAVRLLQSKGMRLEKQGNHWQAVVTTRTLLSVL